MGGLKRTLGLASLLFYGVGVIVGAGIYSIVGAAAGEAGHALWLSLLLAGVPALLAGLCYAELGTRYPRAGGSYVYIREALPGREWASFLVGFLMVVTMAATAATVSIAFGGYLSIFVGLPGWVSAALILVACTAINLAGIRESTWVTAACTTIEVLGLVVIIVAGVGTGSLGQGAMQPQWAGVMAAAALCFFVYTGFEDLANLAEEAREPRRDLPRAILVSLGLTTLLYVLVGLAVVALREPADLAASASPLADAAGAAHPRLGTALAWVALFSTGNTALITLIVASRLLYGMAQEGDAPAAFGWTLTRRQTPWVGALVMGAASAAFLPLGRVEVVGSVSSLMTLTIFVCVAGALVLVRRRDGTGGGGFRVPVSIRGVPLVAVLLALSVLPLAAQFGGTVYLAWGGALGLGLLCFLGRRLWARGGRLNDGRGGGA